MTAIRLHAFEPRSRANGPGSRFVVWFQGCSLGCPGCFNPKTHDPAGATDDSGPDDPESPENQVRTVAALVERIAAASARAPAIEGVTLSGGEPMEQPDAALALIRAVRQQLGNLSILMFSGHAIDEIRAMALGPAILDGLDVLIDGRYEAPRRVGRGLRGSDNQRVHLLTERYRLEDVEATPEAEIRIDPQGRLTFTGVAPLRLERREKPRRA